MLYKGLLGGRTIYGVNLLLVALFAFVLFRTAYTDDDSYITFRCVDNLLNGYGLTFNVSERVLAFTNPLWALLHIPFAHVTGEFYYTTLALSMLATCGVLLIASRRLDVSGFLVFLSILISSKAFVDFSSSGLENPLSHLLFVAILSVALEEGAMTRRRIALVAFLSSLLVVNRMDLALIAGPLLFAMCVDSDRRATLGNLGHAVAWGSGVFFWLGFSLFYYGSPFPNTLYAKVWGSGIAASRLLEGGLDYYQLSFQLDPISLVAIAFGLATCLIERERRRVGLAVGLAAYLVYVVQHGSDQMTPRFFSSPTVIAAYVIGWSVTHSRLPKILERRSWVGLAIACLMIANLAGPYVPLKSLDPEWGVGNAKRSKQGRNDHRATMHIGRLSRHEQNIDFFTPDRATEREVQLIVAIGLYSLQRGPNLHVLDIYALPDPLLSRIAIKIKYWRSNRVVSGSRQMHLVFVLYH